jgi:hypothetical protein
VKRASQLAKAQHKVPTYLFSSENSDIVGAAAAKAPVAQPTSFISKIWNENTKLGFYLAVWYLGNIYCK